MKALQLKYFYFTIALFISIQEPIFSQTPDFSKVLNLHKGDSLNISYLIYNGIKITGRKVVAWFPRDSLSQQQMNAIIEMIDKGIIEAEKFIDAPLSWQSHHITEPYTFYFRSDRFISHGSQAGFVSIPFWRIKNGTAPWLHEAMHEMLNTSSGSWNNSSVTEKEWSENMPLWLFEGLPEYIALKVTLSVNLPWYDVFSQSNRTNIDSLFINEMLANEKSSYILSRIGASGVMPELFSADRILYAPLFYHGSSSFVKYLASNYGNNILLNAISSFGMEQATIENLTGKSLQTLKKEWLTELKIIR